MIRVQAQHLLPGDYLPATKRTVVARSQAGLRTPKGKVNDGTHVWGARTLIGVRRLKPVEMEPLS